jgi:hypothetical protein
MQEHYCANAPVKIVPIGTGSHMSACMRRYLFPGARQDKRKQSADHAPHQEAPGSAYRSDQGLQPQLARRRKNFEDVKTVAHKLVGLADDAANELEMRMAEQRALEQRFTYALNNADRLRHASQRLQQILRKIDTPSTSGEVPPILLRVLTSQETYTECGSDKDAAGSDRHRDAPPPITPRETPPSPVVLHAGQDRLHENKVTKLCAAAPARSMSRSRANVQRSQS